MPIEPPGPSLHGVGLESAGAIRGEALVGVDQETALLSVQTERTRLLDKEIAQQIEELEELNKKLELYNEVLSGLKTVEGRFAVDAKYSKRIGDRFDPDLFDRINRGALAARIDLGFESRKTDHSFFFSLPDAEKWLVETGYRTMQGMQLKDGEDVWRFLHNSNIMWWERYADLTREASDLGDGGYMHPEVLGQPPNRCPGGLRHDSTFSELKKAVNKVKGLIDDLGNVQQDQMLRLQSLMNKRNEAAEMMSNYVRKMQEGRSTIAAKIGGT